MHDFTRTALNTHTLTVPVIVHRAQDGSVADMVACGIVSRFGGDQRVTICPNLPRFGAQSGQNGV